MAVGLNFYIHVTKRISRRTRIQDISKRGWYRKYLETHLLHLQVDNQRQTEKEKKMTRKKERKKFVMSAIKRNLQEKWVWGLRGGKGGVSRGLGEGCVCSLSFSIAYVPKGGGGRGPENIYYFADLYQCRLWFFNIWSENVQLLIVKKTTYIYHS